MSEDSVRIPLKGNAFNLLLIWRPLALATGVTVVGLALMTLVHMYVRPLPGIVGTAVILIGLITFVLGRRRWIPRLSLVVSPEKIELVSDRDGAILKEAQPAQVETVGGYYHVTTRYGSGYSPVISLTLPAGPQFVFTHQDYYHSYVWEGDSHEEKRYLQPKGLPEPTHIIEGAAFIFIAKILVVDPALEVTPLR